MQAGEGGCFRSSQEPRTEDEVLAEFHEAGMLRQTFAKTVDVQPSAAKELSGHTRGKVPRADISRAEIDV